jgi:hypothetical protein
MNTFVPLAFRELVFLYIEIVIDGFSFALEIYGALCLCRSFVCFSRLFLIEFEPKRRRIYLHFSERKTRLLRKRESNYVVRPSRNNKTTKVVYALKTSCNQKKSRVVKAEDHQVPFTYHDSKSCTRRALLENKKEKCFYVFTGSP